MSNLQDILSLNNLNPLQITWGVVTSSFTLRPDHGYVTTTIGTGIDCALPASINAGDEFVVHNASTSTFQVRITNTHTIKTTAIVLTTGNHLILEPGDTANLIAISSTVLEIV